jgi:dTDP-4-dehydrorhamnose 3,5-epimerase
MRLVTTKISEIVVIEPRRFGDTRGWFSETYREDVLAKHGLVAHFIQDNHSYTQHQGTLRGLHFQCDPAAQTKLVRCTRGAIMDVAIDLRKGSPTYLQWVSETLSADNGKQLWIPKGFGHGFLTLSDDVEVVYKVDAAYDPSADRSIRYDDPQLNIDWGIVHPILSEKDQKAPLLADSDVNFKWVEKESNA